VNFQCSTDSKLASTFINVLKKSVGGKNNVPFVNVYMRLSIPPRMGGGERVRVRNPRA